MFIYLLVDLISCLLNSAGAPLQKIIKSIRDGTFEYERKEQVLTNWAQYDHAQIYEMVNYPDDIRDPACEADKRIKERTPHRKRGPGRMRSIAGGTAN